MTRDPMPIRDPIPSACDQAGEVYPFNPLAASDFTTVQSAEHRRMQHLADIGATVLIEAYARRELRSFGDSRNIYDYTAADEEEQPDEKTREETALDLAVAAAHLLARELIFRPWDDKPQLVAFIGARRA